jgi:protein farnesyltransferase/geranylgeranyltransferase type-1 subunit alpha
MEFLKNKVTQSLFVEPGKAASIAYETHFLCISALFRVLLARKEYSERALKVSLEAIRNNPADYSCWDFRRQILQKMIGQSSAVLQRELEICDQLCLENPKNYQVRWRNNRFDWLVDLSTTRFGFIEGFFARI